MKKLLSLFPAFLLMSFVLSDPNIITEKERKAVGELLTQTEQGVFDAVKGLSDAQLKFKPSPDRWSVEECVKHIAVTEGALWQMVDANLKQPATPEKRADIKATDDQLLKGIEDRSHKLKAMDALKPENTPYKTLDEALESFKTNREKLIAWVGITNDDLRNHVLTLPVGSFDSYQMLIFIAGHSNRHTQQINEVKADTNFPKN
jgi:hypothetical protein